MNYVDSHILSNDSYMHMQAFYYLENILELAFGFGIIFLLVFLKVFMILHMPTGFFLSPQAPSQSESETEKPALCNVPPSSPSVFSEMGSDCAQPSATAVSEDEDKEDEFGYSWSKLSRCDVLNYKKC